MNDNETTGPQPPRRRKHAWADVKEVLEEYGPNHQLLKSWEKWIYTTPKDESDDPVDWPTRRDSVNVLFGAVLVLLFLYLRSTPPQEPERTASAHAGASLHLGDGR